MLTEKNVNKMDLKKSLSYSGSNFNKVKKVCGNILQCRLIFPSIGKRMTFFSGLVQYIDLLCQQAK